MNLADHINSMPKKAKKKPIKKPAESTVKTIEKQVAISPVIKVIEQPNYSPEILKQGKLNEKIASQAIASMRDSVNNNQAVIGEIIRLLTDKPMPIRFDIQRDGRGDMSSITPVYDKI